MEIWPSSASSIPNKNYFVLKSILTCYCNRNSSSSTCMYIAQKMQELILFFLKFPCCSCQVSRQSTQLKLFFFQLELPSLFSWCFSSSTLCSFSLHCVLLVSRVETLKSFYWFKFRMHTLSSVMHVGIFFSQGDSKSNLVTLVCLCWDNETIIKLLIHVQLIKWNPNLLVEECQNITLLVFVFIYNNIQATKLLCTCCQGVKLGVFMNNFSNINYRASDWSENRTWTRFFM